MRNLLKLSAVLGLLFLATPASAQSNWSFGFSIGTPPPAPRAYRVAPYPGPGYEWVEGYWYPEGNRWRWHDGYWTRAPYEGAYWVAPYWDGGRFYEGYWAGSRADFRHDHRWDRDHDRRDWNRERREERREEHR